MAPSTGRELFEMRSEVFAHGRTRGQHLRSLIALQPPTPAGAVRPLNESKTDSRLDLGTDPEVVEVAELPDPSTPFFGHHWDCRERRFHFDPFVRNRAKYWAAFTMSGAIRPLLENEQ